MILTKDLAERAKELVGKSVQSGYKPWGVCAGLWHASKGGIDVFARARDDSFWADADFPTDVYKWNHNEEDIAKRRIFIDSLIGKDL